MTGESRPRVLYVDHSCAFGGGTQSLSYTLGGMTCIEALVLTCQDPDVVAAWYKGYRVYRFRRLVNYRARRYAFAWLQGHVPSRMLQRLGQHAYALLDVAVFLIHTVRTAWLVRTRGVVLVHANNGMTALEPVVAARLAGVPCVVHMRGFEKYESRRERMALRMVDRFICISEAVAEHVRRSVPSDRVVTLPNPVPIEAYDGAASARERVRVELGIAAGDVAVGLFGRVVPWKGQLEFVRSVLQALPASPRIRGVIVGDESDGSASYFQAVQRVIADSGFSERFTLTGFRTDVASVYAAMDVVAHASIEPEPFGRVIIEGMAARKPVIATASGGPLEIVEDGVDGFLVRPGDVAAMALAIGALASDPELRQRMGARGYGKARARYSTRASVEGLLAAYAALGVEP